MKRKATLACGSVRNIMELCGLIMEGDWFMERIEINFTP